VEMSRDASFANIESSESTTSPEWSKSLSVGRYFVRVRAVDSEGLVSASSPVRKLGVIAVKLPAGSNVDATTRTFTVPQGRSLEMPDATGLESALDNGAFTAAQRFVMVDGL